MPEVATAQSAQVEAPHFAAALYREAATTTEATVKAMMDLRKSEAGGRSMIKAMSEGIDAGLMPNYTDMDSAITEEAGNPTQQNKLTEGKKFIKDIDEKNVGADVVKAVGKIFAESPAVCAALSKSTSGLYTPDQIKTMLSDGTFTGVAAFKAIVEAHAKDPDLRMSLMKIAGGVQYPSELANLQDQIDTVDQKINTAQPSIAADKTRFTEADTFYSPLTPAQKVGYDALITQYDGHLKVFANDYLAKGGVQINTYDNASLGAYITLCDTQLATATHGRPFHAALTSAKASATAMQGLIARPDFQPNAGNPGGRSAIDLYRDGIVAKQKLGELTGREKQLNKDKSEKTRLETDKKKKLGVYEKDILGALDKAVAKYHNEILLKDAGEVAQTEAKKKAEDKEKTKEKVTKAKEVLDRFFRLSVFKYDGQKISGWDDAWIKDTIKNQMLQKSPAEMARYFLERVYTQRTNLPPNYQTEIEVLFKDLGVNVPADLNGVLAGLDNKLLADMAAEKVPDLLGYGYARRYATDRLRMSRKEAEFLRAAYTPDFFAKALQAKGNYQKVADEIFGKGVIGAGDELQHSLRKLLSGDNWGGELQKLLKLLAILGIVAAIGVGGFGLLHH